MIDLPAFVLTFSWDRVSRIARDVAPVLGYLALALILVVGGSK